MCIHRNPTRIETLLRTREQPLFLSVSSGYWMYPTLSAITLSHSMTTLDYRWRPLISLQPISRRISDPILLFSSTWTSTRRCATGSTTTRMTLVEISAAEKALARISNAVVVATYVDPPLLDGFGSSTVCRYPVIRPRLDINKVIETVPELRFPHPCRRGGAQRRLATLKLRLAMKIQARIVSVLHLVDFLKDHAALAFLRDFRDSATLPSENAALDACNKISRITLPSADRVHPLASRILLGKTEVLEHDVIEWSKDIPDVVLVNHGDGDVTGRLVTSDLRTLLTFVDPVNNVFNTGRRMFSSYLTQTSVEDYLSGDPLEVAYAWVLATDSAVTGSISFTAIAFRAKIFALDDSSQSTQLARFLNRSWRDCAQMFSTWWMSGGRGRRSTPWQICSSSQRRSSSSSSVSQGPAIKSPFKVVATSSRSGSRSMAGTAQAVIPCMVFSSLRSMIFRHLEEDRQ